MTMQDRQKVGDALWAKYGIQLMLFSVCDWKSRVERGLGNLITWGLTNRRVPEVRTIETQGYHRVRLLSRP